jgi:hypothetical protein
MICKPDIVGRKIVGIRLKESANRGGNFSFSDSVVELNHENILFDFPTKSFDKVLFAARFEPMSKWSVVVKERRYLNEANHKYKQREDLAY